MSNKYLAYIKGGTFLAVFDDAKEAAEYAKENGCIASPIPYNPSFTRMYRVSLICGELWNPSDSIQVRIQPGDGTRRSHGQIYAGNPGVWEVYVKAQDEKEAKSMAREFVIAALERI